MSSTAVSSSCVSLDHPDTQSHNHAIKGTQAEAPRYLSTHQALACPRWQHPQQQDPQNKPGNVEQPGEDLDDIVDPHRPAAGDDAQEDGAQREQDHEGDGRYDPVCGPAAHGRLVVEALAVAEPEAAAAAVAVTAAAAAATAVARGAAAGIPAVPAAASPAAELGEGWVGERG